MRKIVLTGCFDLLTRAHIEFINFAKELIGKDGYVYVLIDEDEKVKKDKGEDRPFNTIEDRAFVLGSITNVDAIISFKDEEELVRLLSELKPEYRLLGSDWKGKTIVGAEHCKNIVYFDRIEKYSTTNVLKGIKPKDV